MKIIFAAFLCLLISCSSRLSDFERPSVDRYRQDDLYCWFNDGSGWRVKGLRDSCPYGTIYYSGDDK